MKKLFLLYVLPLIMAVAACQQERYEDFSDNFTKGETAVTFSMQMQGHSAANTYAMTSVDENTVNNIYVLAFKVDENNKEIFSYSSKGSNIRTSESNDRIKTFTTNVIVDNEKYNFLIIANAEAELLSRDFTGLEKADVISNLLKTKSDKWVTTTGSAIPIPMSYETGIKTMNESIVASGITGIKLVRMLARINVTTIGDNDIAIPVETFELTGVYINNARTSGYIAYDANWNTVAREVATNNKTRLEWGSSFVNENAMVNEIYTFEAKNTGAGLAQVDATCVIIKGKYNEGSESYYRLDFFEKSTKQIKDILRNYSYTLNIKSVTGDGYDNIDDAINSRPLNIESELVDWQDGEFDEIVFDGQYYMMINPREFSLSQSESTNSFTVKTNHPSWTATVSDTDNWIEIASPTPNSEENSWRVDFTVPLNETTSPIRHGVINVVAGKINATINVEQLNSIIPHVELSSPFVSPILIPTSSSALTGMETYEFKVHSNIQWEAKIKSGSDIIDLITTQGEFVAADGLDVETTVQFRDYIGNNAKGGGRATIVFTAPGSETVLLSVDADLMLRKSNSYIVKTGSVVYIPVSQANIITSTPDRITASDNIRAVLQWTDNPLGMKGTKDNLTVTNLGVYGTGDRAYLIVETGKVKGNALVSANIGSAVKWSWHIWVTDEDIDANASQSPLNDNRFVFMDRNLGALSARSTDPLPLTAGLHYQFGRKDPFPIGAVFNEVAQVKNIALISGTINNDDHLDNPTNIYYKDGGDWHTKDQTSGWWSTTYASKGPFDPCPYGWQVPISGAWGTDNKNFRDQRDTKGSPFYGSNWYANTTVNWYPAAGRRHNKDGKIAEYNTKGRYWVTNVENTLTFGLDMPNSGDNGVDKFNITAFASNAMSVRCVRKK